MPRKKLNYDSRILLLTTGGQDYMQDDLLCGFRTVFGKRAVDFPRKDILYMDFEGNVHPRPEYAMNARYFVTDDVDRTEDIDPKNFDFVINLSCRRNNGLADIYIDGEDDEVVRSPYPGGILFKRELPELGPGMKVHPITFGLPDHLAPLMPSSGLFSAKKVEVHSSFTVEHGPNRRRLAATWPVEKHRTRAEYVSALNEARFVLSPKGAGWDCQRHYEILGRAVPVIEVNDDAPAHFKEMWRDGENCLTFWEDPAIIQDKIAAVTPRQWDDMVMCGYKELYDKYLATAVAWTVLERAGVL